MAYDALMRQLYPEMVAGGYSRQDVTVEFYGRVQSLLRADDTVLDLGAGRGRFHENPSPLRRLLTDLRGDDRTVVAVDPDPVVLENRSADQTLVMPDEKTIPLPDSSCDLVVANWVLEHVSSPTEMALEIGRVLRPGGWVCAQTPNKWGYIAVAARVVPNAAHTRVLRYVQPERETRDVFPTEYLMNTPRALRRLFPGYLHVVYGYQGPPMYMGRSLTVHRAARVVLNALPEALAATLLVFLRKPGGPDRSGSG